MIIYLQILYICMDFIHFFQFIWAHNKKLLERWHSFNVCLCDILKHNLYFNSITCTHIPLSILLLVHGYGRKSQRTTIQISKYQKLKDKLFPSGFLSLESMSSIGLFNLPKGYDLYLYPEKYNIGKTTTFSLQHSQYYSLKFNLIIW